MINYKKRPTFPFVVINIDNYLTYHNFISNDLFLLYVKDNNILKYKGSFGRGKRIIEIIK